MTAFKSVNGALATRETNTLLNGPVTGQAEFLKLLPAMDLCLELVIIDWSAQLKAVCPNLCKPDE
jgi:hypothetical protein